MEVLVTRTELEQLSTTQSIGGGIAYQSLSSAVQSMLVISPELGVNTLERGVPLGLGALDAVEIVILVFGISICGRSSSKLVPVAVRLARLVVLGRVLRLC